MAEKSERDDLKRYKGTIVIHRYEKPTDELKKELKIEVIVQGENPEKAMGEVWNVVDSNSIPELRDRIYPDLYIFEITDEDEIKEAV